MPLVIIAFLAGVLTALAPCVLPIIPVVIGGSVGGKPDRRKPFIVCASLLVSIVAFTLLLKGSTLLISVPDVFWRTFSGVMIAFFGLTLFFPLLWDKLTAWTGIFNKSQRALGGAYKKGGVGGAIMIGAMLGPVFSSCSPVYLFILSTVLPRNFAEGVIYIVAYALGLCVVLLLVGIFGQKVIAKFAWATNPYGWFKRGTGVLLVLAGLAIMTGADRSLQQYVVDRGILDITEVEQKLLE